ncbi:hypothetical protein [Sphingobium aquiterrae]|uniref:hypothetical protein n=1 Tax=Sphingobium aquiterrae TaxID=2038656 RepID=UPI00301B65DE
MRKVSRDDLRMELNIVLMTMPGYLKTHIRKIAGRDLSTERIVDMLVDRLDNEGSMVVRTDIIGFSHDQRPGKWGVDEPAPAT